MKSKLIIASLLALSFVACKRQYAMVQPAQTDDFLVREKKAKLADFSIEKIESEEIISEKKQLNEGFIILEDNSETTEYQYITSDLQKKETINVLEHSVVNKGFNEIKRDPTKKRKKPLVRRVNAFVPMGLLSLVLAIILALINLNGLAFLFAIASLFFLYLGVKKYLKRQKRRQIFK